MSKLSDSDKQIVLEILVKELGVEVSELTPDAVIQRDLGADSLTVVEIIMAVEERFELSIPDEMAERVSTVGDLLEVLGEMLEGRGQSEDAPAPK